MPIKNSPATYGSISKTFHWLTALMILSTIPLGIIANNLADRIRDASQVVDDSTLALTATLFSMHKTLGVSIFFVALARILWALTQPKPGLLNGDKPAEAWLAETVHWLLYGALVAVPLTGWITHAATTGFAPIWWPLGQTLPFVPKNHELAELTSVLHYILQWVLIAVITLHVAGALKHHVIDRDATLRRMLPGHGPARPTAAQPGHTLPALTAIAIWLGVLGGADMMGWFSHVDDAAVPQTTALEQADSDWQVRTGQVQITVKQLGSDVSGQFADWTAAISYAGVADPEGSHGSVEVTVNVASLTLGSVTSQAMGPDYFDVQNFPAASFKAKLLSVDGANTARGTLTIRNQSVPVEIPFELRITGNEATASGQLTIDRRNFGIGKGVPAEASLGFAVQIEFALTALRE